MLPLVFNENDNKVKTIYQPRFPLEYDKMFGPYKPITSETDSIQQDFQHLLMTNPGEWPMRPDLGIGLKRYLFENYGSEELGKLFPRATRQLSKYLPQVTLFDVSFSQTEEDMEENFLKIIFRYSIFGTSKYEMLVDIFTNKETTDVRFSMLNTLEDANKFLGNKKELQSGLTQFRA